MPRGKNQHVVKHPKGWAVKGEGNTKATKVTTTQAEAIEVAEEIGAKCILGQAYLGLGLLHKETGQTDKAKTCLSRAVQIFEQCDAETHLKEAEAALAV